MRRRRGHGPRGGRSPSPKWSARLLTAAFVSVLSILPAVAAVPVAAAGTPSSSAGAAPRVVAGPAPLPRGAVASGLLPPATVLHLGIVLRPRDPVGLAAFLRSAYSPGSPNYHRFLARGQFGPRFGATPSQIASVTSALRSLALTPGPVAADRLYIPVSGTVSAIGATLHTSFRRVKFRGGAPLASSMTTEGYSNVTPATLPSKIASHVATVVGLSDVLGIHPNYVLGRRPVVPSGSSYRDGSTPGDTPASMPAGLAPASLPTGAVASSSPPPAGPVTCGPIGGSPVPSLGAYQASSLYSAGLTGSGVTIALFELSGYQSQDVSTFESDCGLHTSVVNVPVDGGAAMGPMAIEPISDIEATAAVAPGATVQVYNGPNPWDIWSAIVNQDTAQIVSTSWDSCEQGQGNSYLQAESTFFAQAAAQGQSIFAASGDWGASGCNYSGSGPMTASVEDPASQPWVTGVGGTNLSLNSSGTRSSEVAWSGSGGGISQYWSRPSWQVAPGVSEAAYPNRMREVPDVAASASPSGTPYYFYCTYSACGPPGWGAVGGTSLAAPLWAALSGVVQQACGTSLGFVAPALYDAAQAGRTGVLTDVTSGSNADGGPGYPAGPGYDMVTGLGAPNAAGLQQALCGTSAVTLSPSGLSLHTAAGVAGSASALVANHTSHTVPVGAPTVGSPFSVSADTCPTDLPAGGSCSVSVSIQSDTGGTFGGILSVPYGSGAALSASVSATVTSSVAYSTAKGYWVTTAGGNVYNYGDATWYGSPASVHPPSAVVGMAQKD